LATGAVALEEGLLTDDLVAEALGGWQRGPPAGVDVVDGPARQADQVVVVLGGVRVIPGPAAAGSHGLYLAEGDQLVQGVVHGGEADFRHAPTGAG
jgi:hypothetical protein